MRVSTKVWSIEESPLGRAEPTRRGFNTPWGIRQWNCGANDSDGFSASQCSWLSLRSSACHSGPRPTNSGRPGRSRAGCATPSSRCVARLPSGSCSLGRRRLRGWSGRCTTQAPRFGAWPVRSCREPFRKRLTRRSPLSSPPLATAMRRCARPRWNNWGHSWAAARCGPAPHPVKRRCVRSVLRSKITPPRVRNTAGLALWNMGPSAISAAGDLDRALDGPDRSVRVLAAMTLLKINDRDANNVSQSRLSLRERTSFRGAKGDNDSRPGPKRTDSRPRVAAAMTSLLADHSDPFNHWRAVHTLKDAIGEEALAAKLVSFLKDLDTTVRHGAMDDLKTHCPAAAAATAGVKDALGSPDGMIRCDAAILLLPHHAELAAEALDVLAAEIVNPTEGTYFFSSLIRELKKASPRSLPKVARSLADALPQTSRPERRTYIILALGEIGRDARVAVPALLEAASSGDRLVAVRAIESLTKIDRGSAAAKMPALLDWMNPGHETAVRSARWRPCATSARPPPPPSRHS